MNKLFEVPYNFSISLLNFYKKHSSYISFLYLPPYKDDSINTRTSIETKKKGRCYMPQSREEYEEHLHKINKAGLRYVVLWQDIDNTITHNMLDYYARLDAFGFIIANDKNAKIIKEYNPSLLVICSLVQRLCANVSKKDFCYYDYLLLYYPFNRSLDALKQLQHLKDKIIIMPNTLCNIDCPSIHHWFPPKNKPFVQNRDCMALIDKHNYVKRCGLISPEHLCLFDNYVGGYKLQGREYSTDMLMYICQIYFEREAPTELYDMLGKDLSFKLQAELNSMSLNEYYNIKTDEIINII